MIWVLLGVGGLLGLVALLAVLFLLATGQADDPPDTDR
jgi:hypothetical protein